jgi:hypothetical protein
MAIPISNVTRRQVYAPSGSGGVGPYAFTFEILANTDIAVFKDDTLLTLTTHYTVTINANGTGSVTITSAGLALAPVSPTQYAIIGNRTVARSTDFTTGGDFFANTLNDELDQQTIFAQQNAEGLTRALTAPQTDPTTIDMTLPRAADRANKTLAFDSVGDPTLGISAADVANAVTYATNAAASATAAAASASAASSSASAASGSASTASTQASNASTSASNASTSASNASTSATSATASASTATTQASNASTSATAAASSASAASTSASNASTSATNASNSATTASTQASNASTSASNASTSATSAANSAAAAASALDSFDDRYLGTKSSDPTLDNDGNALVAGALYFSTTQNVMKVYDGSSWIAATSAGATSLLRFRYVATSGQTTFSGADSASATLSYTVNNIAVHRNGVTLDTSEYTASNGTSIVLAVAAGTGDIIDIIAFKSFTVSDALSATSGGTVNGAVTITGALTAQAGTVSLPAITTAGDTNTGIFFPAADTIAFAEGGVEAMRINSSGNVGIGASSPAHVLDISKSANESLVRINGSSSRAYFQSNTSSFDIVSETSVGGPNALYLRASGGGGLLIDSSGNVGIGTASPLTKLYVEGLFGTSTTALTVSNSSGASASNIARIEFRSGNSFGGLERTASIDAINPNAGANNGGTLVFSTSSNGTATTPSERARIDSSGNLLVGTTSTATPSQGFVFDRSTDSLMRIGHANGTGSGSNYILFAYNSGTIGSITQSGTTAVLYNTTSDQRLKENIQDADSASTLIDSLKVRQFNWKTDNSHQRYGFVAQELVTVAPEAVHQPTNEEDMMAVDYSKLVPMLVKEIQSLRQRITALEGA